MKKFLVPGIAMLMLAGASPQAGAVTVIDEYWGGGVIPAFYQDVQAGPHYEIDSMVAERSGTDLLVTVNTDFVNHIGDADIIMGSLMIGRGEVGFAGTGPRYETDTYFGDPDRFNYMFDYDIANSAVTGGNGTGKLYAIGGVADVVETTLRKEQVYDRKPGAGTDTGIKGTWSIAKGPAIGAVTFKILDIFSLAGIDSTSLILSWTMSCGNDVVIGSALNLGNGSTASTPIPAGALLLFSGLGALGFSSRRRKA